MPYCSAQWFFAALCGWLHLSCGLAFRTRSTVQQQIHFSFPALHHLSSPPCFICLLQNCCLFTSFLCLFSSFFLLLSLYLSLLPPSPLSSCLLAFLLIWSPLLLGQFEKPIYSAKLDCPLKQHTFVCCKWDGFFHRHGQLNCGLHTGGLWCQIIAMFIGRVFLFCLECF